MDGVTFENNSAPATTWGTDEAEAVADNQGSDLVMRSTGDGEVRNLLSVTVDVFCRPHD